MEDALSVGDARYSDFDVRFNPWGDLTTGITNIEEVLERIESGEKNTRD